MIILSLVLLDLKILNLEPKRSAYIFLEKKCVDKEITSLLKCMPPSYSLLPSYSAILLLMNKPNPKPTVFCEI
jgi:hypothetical protein